MANDKIILWSRHQEKGWKEAWNEATLEKRDDSIVLVESSSGDNPYKGEVWDNNSAYRVSVEDLLKWMKEHGEKVK